MPKMTYTAVYQQPRTLLRYDSERVIIYPDERVEDNYQPEKTADNDAPSPYKAYIYTGEERDGGLSCLAQTRPTIMRSLTPSFVHVIPCLMSSLFSVIIKRTLMLMLRSGKRIARLLMPLLQRQKVARHSLIYRLYGILFCRVCRILFLHICL